MNELLQHTLLFENEEQADKSACFPRFGHIVSLNETRDSVKVEFEHNPFGQPLSAKLGRAFRKAEIEMAIASHLTCRIEFVNNDIGLPVVTDIFFSMLDDSDEVVLRANKLVIDTSQELVVKSGETETRYSGRDNRISTKAKYVTSQAEKAQKIQGGTISFN
ncbi:hypothetical protein [Enterovibrio nigricans]|uniref:Uncharacterized protein n=1 Tax=Enterovibrio nigricans DSM 22720 TaxID=1121868 RepID=A0A1T4VAD4_9GAMM|nr:hypothetical protein [Enterovibrio nigricans]PKF50037.1 hypothetical protein AT251_14485 [Enterovibrio nigricans]SKA61883.1 hypothetical protein SAMN02745132_03542 [Enterovibrio nigricans DSM 22720]